MFSRASGARLREGNRVRLLKDAAQNYPAWLGGLGKTSRAFWNRLRAGGVDVRCYNPPRFDSPFGWVSRDHRKMIALLAFKYPRGFAYPFAAVGAWVAAALLYRGFTLLRERESSKPGSAVGVTYGLLS